MGLRLKQIWLKNWKCYQDQKIIFNLNTDKNIWIIFGQNGSGKTSILEAIIWCLYGNISQSKLLDYFNRVALKKKPELTLSVQLNFEEKGKYYHISRTATRTLRGKTAIVNVDEATYLEDGQKRNNPRDYIEALLPRLCKDFFCFDGVKIEQYAQVTQTTEAKDAIEKILGIPELKNLREDSEKALQALDKRLNQASQSNQTLNQLTEKLRETEEDIDIKKGQLEEARQDHEQAIKIHQDAQERARQIEDLRILLDDLAQKEQQRKQLEEKLESAKADVENSLKKAPLPLLLEFVQEMVDDLQRKTIKTNRKSSSVTQLKEILKTNNCLCGRCLDESSRVYIQQQLEELANLGQLTQQAIEQDNLKTSLATLLRYKTPDFDGLMTKRDRIEDDLEDLKQAISNLKKNTEGTNQQEANEIWKKVGETEQMVRDRQERINRLNKEIEQLFNHAEKLRQQIETLANQNQETATISQQVKLAKGLRDAANELIEWHIDRCKHIIETKTTERYLQVTNKPDEYVGIEIQEDYTIGVRTVTGEILNPEILSAGEKEALAFAFITGLNLASATSAPLIMDTPFGHLDTQHQHNIINSLPNLPSQVIILATDRDLPEPLLQTMRSQVAEIQYIRRLDATEDGSIVETEE